MTTVNRSDPQGRSSTSAFFVRLVAPRARRASSLRRLLVCHARWKSRRRWPAVGDRLGSRLRRHGGAMFNVLLVVQGLVAGMLIPVQSSVNAQVARHLGHGLWGTVTNFAVGLVALLVLCALLRLPLPVLAKAGGLPWYFWLGGGVMGAFFVFTSLSLAPRIGVTALLIATLAGQLVASVAMDHFGVLGLPQQSVSPGRIAGVLLVVAGVYLVRRF
ncbi:MAG: DMT family transporter [Alphaproteobacteria bacterium]|nr:DMT family transporter [Alphaproteobacteria bacterium]